MNLFRRCDMGLAGRVWPDGGALLDQPNRLIDAFDIVGAALERFKRP